MIICVLLCYHVSFHMLQLLLTGQPISSYGLLGYCFHPWCPDGRAGGRKKFVGAVSQKP